MQLNKANKSLDALRESRNGPLSRYKYYASLIEKLVASLAETDTEYAAIEMTIPAPTLDSDLALSDVEKSE